MPRYANVDKLMEHAISLDWSVLKWVNEVDISTAINPNVVTVVRCKDCINGIPTRIDTVTGDFSDERYCYRHSKCHVEDYYCADGKQRSNITAKWLIKGHAEDFFECSNCGKIIDCHGKGNPPLECPKCHAYMIE